MTWIEEHKKSEQLAAQAETTIRMGRTEEARHLYLAAAEAEAAALRLIQPDKHRTLGITAISAASLFFKAGEPSKAELLALASLANEATPLFAREELQAIVQTIWNERTFRASGIEFVRGELLVAVAGGVVGLGAAPLELIHRKIEEIKNLFFRTVEMLVDIPLRRHGAPSQEIREQFRPWLLHAPAGSYQFALRVEKPRQMDLFPNALPELEDVTEKLLRIVEASSMGHFDTLDSIVRSEGYRDCFMKQLRNLAPTGKTFERLTIKPAGGADIPEITFFPQSRKAISECIRSRAKPTEEESPLPIETIVGTLRGLQLEKDWLDVVRLDDRETVRVYEAGETIDDVIGPMVNHTVEVEVFVHTDGKRVYKDIQSQE